MKKLLLVLCGMLFVWSGVLAQREVDRIAPWPIPNETYQETKYVYRVYLKSGTGQTNIQLVCENGVFDNNGTSMWINNVDNVSYKEFNVKWNKLNGDGVGKIKASTAGTDITIEYKVNLKSKPEVPKPEEPKPGVDKNISGPKTVYFNENIQYSTELGFVCYGGASKYTVTWDYDKNVFDIVSYYSVDCVDRWKINLKVKNIEKESLITLIKTKGIEKFDGKTYDTDNGYYWVTVKYRPTNLSIKKSTDIVCSNTTVSYQLEGLASFATNYTITWEAGANLTLASGQGTKNATFKGSGNGYGKVKATIKYDGKEYAVENSDVWVGTPKIDKMTYIDKYSQEVSMYGIYVNEPVTLVADVSGVKENQAGHFSQWDKFYGPERFNLTNTSLLKATANIHTAGMVSLYYTVGNQCGTTLRKKYTLTAVDDRPNGGGSFVPGIQSLSIPSPLHIKVYSLITGSLVYQEKNVIDFNIQNTGLKEGLYIVEKTDNNGNVTKDKVAKTK